MADKTSVSPYETDPAKIPSNDRYADLPLYGRYGPRSDDFTPPPEYANATSSPSEEVIKFWAEVLSRCNDSTMVYKNEIDKDGRDVFAVGSVIIKSGHLHEYPTRDYSFNDANEVEAVALAREPLEELGIRIYGHQVLVQKRIPGVGLNVASQYLNLDEMQTFKDQARRILRVLRTIKPSPEKRAPSYVVPVADPVDNRRIQELEGDIIFSGKNQDGDFCLMHNDFTESNTIVCDGRIVGLVDWEMAGFFGWETARKVHEQIRTPSRESYAALEGKEQYREILQKLFFWKDLYDASG